MIYVRISPLTDAEVIHALGGYRGRRMTWACADAATARAFDRIVNNGDLSASPHRKTFAAGLDRYELADRAIERGDDLAWRLAAPTVHRDDIEAERPPCSRCGIGPAQPRKSYCVQCQSIDRRERRARARQAVPFAEREAKRRAHAGALARVGI